MRNRATLQTDTRGAIAPLVAVTLGCILAMGAIAIEAGRAYLTHARLERALVLAVTAAAPALAAVDVTERATVLGFEANRIVGANMGSGVVLTISEVEDGRLRLHGQATLRLLFGQLIGRQAIGLSAAVTAPLTPSQG